MKGSGEFWGGVERIVGMGCRGGVGEVKRGMPIYVGEDIEAFVEIDEIGATAHENVLTVIEDVVCFGIDKGSSAAT